MGRSITSLVVTVMSANPAAPVSQSSAIRIAISDGYLRYHDSQAATLTGLNIEVPAGAWTCILGRSGCGKSSLLRYLANLLHDKVDWSGELTTEPHCDLQHHIAYMAQQDLLMPWLSVLDNVMLSTKLSRAPRSTAIRDSQLAQARELLHQVGLADKADYLPQQLSGGMRQRVALARTLMQDKPVVLMDEPFSALDAVSRYRLQNLAFELLQAKTVVLITHDPQEAIRLASRLYIMQGRPASAESLLLPLSQVPRAIDAECAGLQQTIMTRLALDYE
ncbi:ABC transporter ATP-binding protein [Amphritea sp. 1_MG-2023]|uniref:ABC transporter ATP-binding protein n=1 Tax=Amphritea sp. 1_MG-2023 TaxID=3062670 RepID=UPI0026E1C15A|nr:ABC transporter ATP-binding protein [Amphritea sp. 1_MG-2023]MDO6563764.1 ABC transporter ATP-binding protein [Amphritea sp. 1_MG-2023]